MRPRRTRQTSPAKTMLEQAEQMKVAREARRVELMVEFYDLLTPSAEEDALWLGGMVKITLDKLKAEVLAGADEKRSRADKLGEQASDLEGRLRDLRSIGTQLDEERVLNSRRQQDLDALDEDLGRAIAAAKPEEVTRLEQTRDRLVGEVLADGEKVVALEAGMRQLRELEAEREELLAQAQELHAEARRDRAELPALLTKAEPEIALAGRRELERNRRLQQLARNVPEKPFSSADLVLDETTIRLDADGRYLGVELPLTAN